MTTANTRVSRLAGAVMFANTAALAEQRDDLAAAAYWFDAAANECNPMFFAEERAHYEREHDRCRDALIARTRRDHA